MRPMATFSTVAVLGILLGCAGEQKQVKPTVFVPRFQYTYPTGEGPANDITVALVRPSYSAPGYSDRQGYKEHRHVAAYRAAIASQLQEMLTTKGFRLTGPFDSLNDMTFPDKKAADLALTPQVTLNWTFPKGGWQQSPPNPWTGQVERTFWMDGNCEASGFVSYILVEPMSGEKLWIKKIELQPEQVDCTVKGAKDDAIYQDAVGKILEVSYQAAMAKAWSYLSPEELTLLKQKARELREKKVY